MKEQKLLFLDCEFTSLDQASQLLSIALYENDEQYCYIEISDYETSMVSPWHQTNVIDRFTEQHDPEKNMAKKYSNALVYKDAQSAVEQWLTKTYAQCELTICADCYAWDWILFCELFGGSLNLPEFIHYIPLDLATMLHMQGYDRDTSRVALAQAKNPEKLIGHQHNALYDARLSKVIYELLLN